MAGCLAAPTPHPQEDAGFSSGGALDLRDVALEVQGGGGDATQPSGLDAWGIESTLAPPDAGEAAQLDGDGFGDVSGDTVSADGGEETGPDGVAAWDAVQGGD